MQAGGRRFDSDILHQFYSWFNTKAALQEAALLLIDIDRSIGCSLTIHRVESASLAETAFMADRAASDILIASTRLQFRRQNRKYEDGITREVKDLAKYLIDNESS